MTAVRQAANRDGTETALDRLWIDESDFTAGETWRLLRWCQSQGADEFTVDVHDSGQRPGTNRFNHFLRPTAVREHLRNAGDGPRDTTVYRLDANSISALQVLFPSGLFQSPSYGAAEPWAEDPIFYRNGQLMLAIISHEEFGEMRLRNASRSCWRRLDCEAASLATKNLVVRSPSVPSLCQFLATSSRV